MPTPDPHAVDTKLKTLIGDLVVRLALALAELDALKAEAPKAP